MKKTTIITLITSLSLIATGCTSDLTDAFTKVQDFSNTVQSINSSLEQADGHVVIVPGYGVIYNDPTYEGYVEAFSEYIEDEDNEVTAVVFTGSYSTTPDITEAAFLNGEFNNTVAVSAIQSRGIHVYKEECAITSWQNIGNTKDLLDDKAEEYSRVTVWG